MLKELTMKEIQEGSLEVLKTFIGICEENNFQYFIAYGSLIGVVRHKGFIPWDDDLDVWMPRKDYERFIEYCIENSDRLKPLQLHHYRTNKNYIYAIARLSDSRYVTDYYNVRNYGLGLFIDIYPLDGCEADEKFLKRIYSKRSFIYLCSAKDYVSSTNKMKNVIRFPLYFFCKHVDLSKKLRDLDKFSQKYKYGSSTFITCTCWDPAALYKTEWFENSIEADFEGIKVRIPERYDEILRAEYGDYMKLPPESERYGRHNYKAYKK